MRLWPFIRDLNFKRKNSFALLSIALGLCMPNLLLPHYIVRMYHQTFLRDKSIYIFVTWSAPYLVINAVFLQSIRDPFSLSLSPSSFINRRFYYSHTSQYEHSKQRRFLDGLEFSDLSLEMSSFFYSLTPSFAFSSSFIRKSHREVNTHNFMIIVHYELDLKLSSTNGMSGADATRDNEAYSLFA